MRVFLFAFAVLCCGGLAGAQDRPSFDELIQQLLDLRLKQADLKKQEEKAAAELKQRLKELQDQLDKLDIDTRPKPPKPPEPKPPEPNDPLRQRLEDAFKADRAQLDLRRKHGSDLIALYKLSVGLCEDKDVTSAEDLLARFSKSAKLMVGAEALIGVRREVGRELEKLLPSEGPLTPDQRAAVAALFLKLAELLTLILMSL